MSVSNFKKYFYHYILKRINNHTKFTSLSLSLSVDATGIMAFFKGAPSKKVLDALKKAHDEAFN
jgi:hypothetical protein